ncbi:MAG: aldolase catalytic domain-containing protein [Lachnospiraceae bacterium]
MNREENTLLGFRKDIRILDCTLRDGGLVNNFGFTEEFIKELYETNVKSGVDYMEFGYKADKDEFSESEYGKWKFTKEEDLRAIVGDNNTALKISIMADAGRTNYMRDILPKEESVIDMIRIAAYIHQIPAAIEMIEDAHAKGYETTINIMAVSKVQEDALIQAIEVLAQTEVDVIYLVDSFGVFYPEQIVRLSNMYIEIAEKYGKKVGIHAHNNQQLAFANTIESLRCGVSYLDATVSGMGRGAGNCFVESLLGFLRNPKYKLTPMLRFIAKQIPLVKASGAVWGFDTAYMLTGIFNSHPSSAIKFLKDERTDYANFYQTLLED